MKVAIYSILDNVSGAYGQPQVSQNDGTASRSIKDLMQRDENIRNHANDYALYRIGEFDDNTGTIVPEEKPQLVIKLGTLKEIA